MIPPSELPINADGSVFHLHLRPEQIADKIILVGDPGRVKTVASFFDSIECEVQSREFHTITGTYKGKRISCVSTGIGCDNIDIVMTELDALVNIDLDKRELIKYDDIVFCGYGEPTERLVAVIETCAYLREKGCKHLRINTNGMGDLIHGRSIAAELCTVMDVVSISLNAPTEKDYMEVTRPKFNNAFEALQKFTSDCVKTGKAEIVMSVVDVIPQEQIDASRELAEKLGAVLRVRTFDD